MPSSTSTSAARWPSDATSPSEWASQVGTSEERSERGAEQPGDTVTERSFTGQITLDGPSGTGKSSVARGVARRLGAAYLDTGAMYRAATVAVLDSGVNLDDEVAVARAVSEAAIRVGTNARREMVTVDGVDVRDRIRGAEVTRAVSPVSAVPDVRRRLVSQQRELVGQAEAVVVEGRDIGTVVLPDATLKIYLTAAPEVRAQRRAGQLGVSDPDKIAALAQDLRRRDEYDSTRADSPLRPAADAVVVDSTELDREAVIDKIVQLALSAVPTGSSR
ncbi:MAG: (d)CMP kinase [Blastococcus sp.]|jgi:cytidylate kinase|nr:(d)CMP kinase [Blastococcus sp.]